MMRLHRVSMTELAPRDKIRTWILAIATCALLGAGLAIWWREAPPVQSASLEDSASEAQQESTMGEAPGDPAAALQRGRWPGLPDARPDAESERDSDEAVRYSESEIEEAEKMASAIIDGSYAEMVAAVDDLTGAVEAEIAVEIGDRLFECWDYSDRSSEELETQGAKAFEDRLRLGETFAAQMAPGATEQAVGDLALLDRNRWIDDWITRQTTEQARCVGVETVPRDERIDAAIAWWERAAELGSLEAKAQWIAMAFFSVGLWPGKAVEIAELKPRVIDAVHELLRERYAPVLLNIMLFDGQGIFAQPNPQRAWIYGEALRRIVEQGPAGPWHLSTELVSADLTGLRESLLRTEATLTPAQLREAEAWVRAIVELPAR